MLKKIFPFVFIFSIILILYYPVLFTYFSQDDFFHFKVSQTDGSVIGFLKLFGFYPYIQRDIAFYRPISREIPFNIFYFFFGLNHIPFRTFQFVIHFINIYLVYTLVQKLFNNKFLSLFVSFFFGITAANVATLYYLAGGIQTLFATTFTLLTLITFEKYLKEKSFKYKLISFFTFLLGIASEEQAMIIPFLLIGLVLINQLKIKKFLWTLLPYFLTIIILTYLEITKIGFSSEIQYQAVFNLKTAINSFGWYSAWALGLPETLVDFVLPGLKLNPNLLKYWSNYYIFIFPSFFISVSLLIFSTILLLIKKRVVFKNKVFLLTIVWFPLGLLTILLLPIHKSTHYLEVSLPAFWMIIGFIMFNFYKYLKNKLPYFSFMIITIFILSLTVLSIESSLLGKENYWAASRGKLAQQLITDVKNLYPTLPRGSIIYFKNDPNYPFLTKEWGGSSKQASIILNGSDALQLLYKDPSLRVFYQDLQGYPENVSGTVYSLTAKIL